MYTCIIIQVCTAVVMDAGWTRDAALSFQHRRSLAQSTHAFRQRSRPTFARVNAEYDFRKHTILLASSMPCPVFKVFQAESVATLLSLPQVSHERSSQFSVSAAVVSSVRAQSTPRRFKNGPGVVDWSLTGGACTDGSLDVVPLRHKALDRLLHALGRSLSVCGTASLFS